MKKIKLLLYCCKDKRGYLHFDTRPEITRKYYLSPDSSPFGTYEPDNYLNGKILAECEFEVEEITPYQYQVNSYEGQTGYKTKTLTFEELLKRSCLTFEKLDKYLYCDDIGYAIYIKNLHIFDRAKRLGECYLFKGNYYDFDSDGFCEMMDHYESLDKAPKTMCKVYRLNDSEEECDEYILSVNCREMRGLLNGEQTILVRKRVAKGIL